MRGIVSIVALSGIVFMPFAPEAPGCAPAPPRDRSVRVDSEDAIIFYDSATKTEHFIRRADFRTDAKNFGFLVPTPTKPKLGETPSVLFSSLANETAARHLPSGRKRRIVTPRTWFWQIEKSAAPPAAPAPPKILEQTTVAGYDAVVLSADNTEGLKKWLEDNQYDARPALMEWLKWYVENKWIITAFKVTNRGNLALDRWSLSVRMSFQTDAPFYPYREPEDMRAPAPNGGASPRRALRVYFVGDARHRGTVGGDGFWNGRTVWSDCCPTGIVNQLVGSFGLPAKDHQDLVEKTWRLTEFEDSSSPRPGTNEVYFHHDENQSTVERPNIYYDGYEYVHDDYLGTILGAAAVIGVLAAIIVVARRKRAASGRRPPLQSEAIRAEP